MFLRTLVLAVAFAAIVPAWQTHAQPPVLEDGQNQRQTLYIVWCHNGKYKFEYNRTYSYAQAVQWRDMIQLAPGHRSWIIAEL